MSLLPALRRFFEDHPVSLKSPLVAACSGGPDSTALVLALKDLSVELPLKITVAHINHALRGRASVADARFARQLAKKAGFPYREVKRPVRGQSGNLEEKARVLRYDALTALARRHKAQLVLTAHSLDDQVETVLMNLIRGAGNQGSGGMQPLRAWYKTGVQIGRPLLTVPRHEIETYLQQKRVKARVDHTNQDPEFLRNFLRAKIVPALEKRAPGFKERAGRWAEIQRDEEVFWETYLIQMERDLLTKSGSGRLLDLGELLSYSRPAQRRFLRRILGRDLLTYDGVERLRKWMSAPPSNGRIWQGKQGWRAERLSKSKGSPTSTRFWLGQSR